MIITQQNIFCQKGGGWEVGNILKPENYSSKQGTKFG